MGNRSNQHVVCVVVMFESEKEGIRNAIEKIKQEKISIKLFIVGRAIKTPSIKSIL